MGESQVGSRDDGRIESWQDRQSLPRGVTAGILAACILPALLWWLFGIDLGLAAESAIAVDARGPAEIVDLMHRALRGSFLHLILEWTAFSVAIATVVLALSHLRSSGSVVAPLISVMMFSVGMADAFHGLASVRMFSGAAPSSDFAPFTWAISRMFAALILACGLALVLWLPRTRATEHLRWVPLFGLGLALLAYVIIWGCATRPELPKTMYPGAWISRPFDVIPLIIFVAVAGPMAWTVHRREPGLFTHALMISLIPHVATQLYMAFGSEALYDGAFNVAHGLKVLAYAVPFLGLAMDHQQTQFRLGVAVMQLSFVRAQVTESEQRFQLAVAGSNDGMWDWKDVRDDGQWWSDRFFEIIGYVPRELSASFTAFQDLVHPDERQRFADSVQSTLQESTGSFDQEVRLSHRSGIYRWIRARAQVVRDSQTGVLRMAGSIQDITDRKKAELEKDRMLLELRRSNEELDRFAYAASHDLKSPLRGIDQLTQWLIDDYQGEIPEKAMDDLKLMRDRVRRMDQLLEGLLLYSRVGRSEDREERLEMVDFLCECLELMAIPKGFRVEIPDTLPCIMAPAAAIRQIFVNLVQNGVKHHDRTDGKVVIGYRERGDYHEFSVADDGPGIPPEFHRRIFGLFETLKGRKDGEHGGVGLAIVKKAIETHGGQISVESAPGRGSTFTFTWPR